MKKKEWTQIKEELTFCARDASGVRKVGKRKIGDEGLNDVSMNECYRLDWKRGNGKEEVKEGA